jgi:iron complex outermembrane receptor protein
MGAELTVGVQFCQSLRWDLNATLSRNRIKNYVEYLNDYDMDYNDLYSQTARQLGDKPIAFSPAFMGGSLVSFNLKGWEATLQSNYVGRQYLDNSGSKENSLDAYFVHNLHVGYAFRLPHTKEVKLGATLYNLLNEKYENNGYSQTSALYATDANGHKTGNPTIVSDPRFYPMAGTNLLFNATLSF